MDNLDWKKNTLEGGSFHATTAIIIENCEGEPVARNLRGVSVPSCTSGRKKTLPVVPMPAISACHISARDRKKSRSLDSFESIESLETPSDHTAEEMMLIWKLGHTVITYGHKCTS